MNHDWIGEIPDHWEKQRIKNIQREEFKTKYGFSCPTGVRGRNSDNKLYREKIGWEVSEPLLEGMKKTYSWIAEQVNK